MKRTELDTKFGSIPIILDRTFPPYRVYMVDYGWRGKCKCDRPSIEKTFDDITFCTKCFKVCVIDCAKTAMKQAADFELQKIFDDLKHGIMNDVPMDDPLDVKYDGIALRTLFLAVSGAARDKMIPLARNMTPVQREAVSAHWSAELRAKIAASKERERNQIMVDLDD